MSAETWIFAPRPIDISTIGTTLPHTSAGKHRCARFVGDLVLSQTKLAQKSLICTDDPELRIVNKDVIGNGIKCACPFIAGLDDLLHQPAVLRCKPQLTGGGAQEFFLIPVVGAVAAHTQHQHSYSCGVSFYRNHQAVMNAFAL